MQMCNIIEGLSFDQSSREKYAWIQVKLAYYLPPINFSYHHRINRSLIYYHLSLNVLFCFLLSGAEYFRVCCYELQCRGYFD